MLGRIAIFPRTIWPNAVLKMPRACVRFPDLDTGVRAADYLALLTTLPPFLLPVVPPAVLPNVPLKPPQGLLQHPPPGFESEAAQLRAQGSAMGDPGGTMRDPVPRGRPDTLGTPPQLGPASLRDTSEGDENVTAARVAARLRLEHWPAERERPTRDRGGQICIPKARESVLPQHVPSWCDAFQDFVMVQFLFFIPLFLFIIIFFLFG